MASKRRKAAAAEDEKLRLKSPAKRSSRRKAQDRESPKGKAEAISSCKTPKRSSKSCLPTFSSPANETDLQQEIFWDPQSPIAYKLDSGKKKQTAGRSVVEISEIVNRIAPQEEKPSCHEGSLLGMWIGDDAIPCTPGIAKVRSRTKVNNTRGLRLKNKEEELMKLAKQFDKNLTEAIQEQDAPCHNATRLLSEAEVSVECQGDAQMEDLGEHPQMDTAVPFGVVKEKAEHCEHSSQKPIDLDAELALNALFDCSPQKCSGELSQGSSNSGLHNSQNTVLVEECVSEERAGGPRGAVAAGTPRRRGSALVSDCRGLAAAEKTKKAFGQTIQSAAVSKTETQSTVISKTELAASGNIVSDDFDDWDDLLSNDSFVMQITQNPEVIQTPQNAFPRAFQESCKTKENLDRANSGRCAFPKSSNDDVTLLSLQKQSHELGATKSIRPLKNNTISSFSKSGQNRIPGYNSIPVKLENKIVTGGFTQLKSTGTPVSVHPNLPKQLTVKSRSDSKPGDQQQLASRASSSNLQAGLPKKHSSSFGDWKEPRNSEDVLDLFCESDDDLLYQVCDVVERSTLSQDVVKENVKATLVVVSTAKLEMEPDLPVPKQGLANCPQPQKVKKTSLNAPFNTAELLKSENSAYPCDQLSRAPFKTETMGSIQGKLNRTNFVPGSSLALMTNTHLNANSVRQQPNVTWNAGKVQNMSNSNHASNEKSKYVFRKTSSSQALILDCNSVTAESLGGAPLVLGESKNGPNIPLHATFQMNPKTTLKRHFSDSFANSEPEQNSRKCSQEEIARKKQEALERRKYKMQALRKNTAPT